MKWSWRVALLLGINAAALAAVPFLLGAVNSRIERFAQSLRGLGTEGFGLVFAGTWVVMGLLVGAAQVLALRRQPGWPGVAVAAIPTLVLVIACLWRLSRATTVVAEAQGYYVFSAAGLAAAGLGIAVTAASAYVLAALWWESRRVGPAPEV